MWMSRLRADLRAGTLAPEDRPYAQRLRRKFAYLLDG
jgi:hypothetical protein